MTLQEAIKVKAVVPVRILDSERGWACSRCGKMLIYFMGWLHWGCGCHQARE